ncbi:O-antigen ligase family protein [Akkermansiaceae bacterium]|nr:O-antigen ligase family protein [Akkermansiaceae bacterium]
MKNNLAFFLFTVIPVFSITNVTLFVPLWSQQIYYGLLAVILAYLVIIFRVNKVNVFSITLLLATASSLIFNATPERFNSTFRWLGWVLVVCSLGPMFSSLAFEKFRKRSIGWVFVLCSVVGVGSCLWYILGLPNLGRGHFSGLTHHSMILGPIASIGVLYLLSRVFKKKNRLSTIIPLVACFVAVLLAASRVSLVGCIFSSFILLFCNFRKKIKKNHLLPLSFLAFLFSFVISGEMLLSLHTKGMENSREGYWADRLEEFKTSPVVGIGFATVSPGSNGDGDGDDGGIEPGTSWLAILSMTGVIGFSSFIALIYSSLTKLKKESSGFISSDSSLYLSVVIFFLICFFAEGYVFASGSMLGMIFWLLLGRIFDYNTTNKK